MKKVFAIIALMGVFTFGMTQTMSAQDEETVDTAAALMWAPPPHPVPSSPRMASTSEWTLPPVISVGRAAISISWKESHMPCSRPTAPH